MLFRFWVFPDCTFLDISTCRIRCLPSDVSKRFGLLLSSLPLCLHVAALTQSPSTIDLFNLVIACQCGLANACRQKCAVIPVYRQSPQCDERSNAAFGTQSAAKQTSLAPHDSKARLRLVTTCRDSWRSHVHRTRFRRLRSSSSYKLPMCGVKGEAPLPFSGGSKGGVLFGKRTPSLTGSSAYALHSPSAQCAEKTILPARQPPFTPLGVKQFRGVLCQKNS